MRLRYSRAMLIFLTALGAAAQQKDAPEIPVPPIRTALGALPGPDDLPSRPEMPDVMLMNDGTRVRTAAQWRKRREQIKRILEYYAVGSMPPAPRNVKGAIMRHESVLDGQATYRLAHLTFGPAGKLGLEVGIFTPVGTPGRHPAIILLSGTPPGATALPRLPQGPNQGKGQNVLVLVGPGPDPIPSRVLPTPTADAAARRFADVLGRGYAVVMLNPNDCAEDTTLRNPDGSWAFPQHTLLSCLPRLRLGHTGRLGVGRLPCRRLSGDRSRHR